MKKIICLLMIVALLFTSAETVYAKNHHDNGRKNKHETTYEGHHDTKYGKQEFEIDSWFQIKFGKYEIPVMPITYGMGATITFDDSKNIVIVTKDTNKIEINFNAKTVYVNGVQDNKSGIFTAKNSKKMKTVMKYIAKVLGIWCYFDDDEIIVEVPGLDLPSNITITPVGTTSVANTLNTTTLYLAASAKITAGQATGGRAELYVGSKLVAIDSSIAASDTTVQFLTSDNTPTNAELQALIPTGGPVTVKLYNSSNNSVTSTAGNPTLNVDYIAPTITGINSAIYNASTNQLKLAVTGAGAIGDMVDVTKITIYDTMNGRSYQLTNNSSGSVSTANVIDINIGTNDRFNLWGFSSNSMYLFIAAGSLLKDKAGNTSAAFNTAFTVPVTNTATALDLPTKVTVTPIGATVVDNTLNSTTLYMNATATITAGQATGGRAELYIGNKLVAIDSQIGSTDNTVSFTTSDGSPTNAELQALIPTGGLVTVKLYNTSNNSVTSATGNPTLNVDYIAPTIAGISSAIYNTSTNQLKLSVTGAGAIGDMVDVTKITIYDTVSGRSYQLTNNSAGSVGTANVIDINIGTNDRINLWGFSSNSMYLFITAGSLLKDKAGNTSAAFNTAFTVPVNNTTTALNPPTQVTVTPVGGTVIANTLNSTNVYMNATATITAGQATGGRAELYVGDKLVAIDSQIGSTDTTVTFTTSDGTPDNAELRYMIPSSGTVTVKLTNTANNTVTSAVGNPTLTVDYVAPTISSITSAIYNVPGNQIYLDVTGAGAIGDKVDVSKITLYDTYLGRYYTLTSNAITGSSGLIISPTSIVINVGSVDKANLNGFGTQTVTLSIATGSFITDAAGNSSNVLTTGLSCPVTLIK